MPFYDIEEMRNNILNKKEKKKLFQKYRINICRLNFSTESRESFSHIVSLAHYIIPPHFCPSENTLIFHWIRSAFQQFQWNEFPKLRNERNVYEIFVFFDCV